MANTQTATPTLLILDTFNYKIHSQY